MIKITVYFLMVLMVVSAARADVAAPATAPSTAPSSLLSNSDFQTPDNDGKPAGWAIKDGIAWQTEGDVKFLRFTSTEPGKTVMAYRQLTLPEPHPAALEVHVRVRYSDLKVGSKTWFDGRVMMQFKDGSGKVVKPQPPAPNFHGTSDGWVDKSVFFAIPAKARMLEIMPSLFNVASGTMDLALIDVLPSTADKLPPPPAMVASQTIPQPDASQLPPMLHVDGNQLKTADGKVVWLQGLCLDSLEWSAGGEHLAQSIPVAIEQWHSNCIRLPMKEDFWFGWGKWQGKDKEGMGYRKTIDDAIVAANSRGAYLVIDLHRFGAPTVNHLKFWKDAAIRYKNHPGVIFELFNEPHDISWEVWRNGGDIHSGKNEDTGVKENTEVSDEDLTPGMQAIVDDIRAEGANNLIVAGGLDWSYNISGVLKGYALTDTSIGNGIMYSTHIYPWKKDWQKHFLDVAAKYPLFVGEVGCPEKWEDFKFIPEGERYEKLGPNCPWPTDMIGLIQKYKLNWTAFSFHPHCGPQVISDWDYTPTAYWGTFVKRALAGDQFEVKNMR